MTRDTIEVRGIWLRGDGQYLVVDVELADGRLVEAIRDHSGHAEVVTVSHYVHPSGIEGAPPSTLGGSE